VIKENVLEFIQCPHCQKQYTVNDRLRKAVGKKIRCKYCSQPFEIKIQAAADITKTQDVAVEAAQSESIQFGAQKVEPEVDVIITPSEHAHKPDVLQSGGSPASEEQQEVSVTKKKEAKKGTPAKKKINIQLLITILLSVSLVVAVSIFLLSDKVDLLGSSAEKDVQSIIPQELIKPLEFGLPIQKEAPAAYKEKVKTIAKEPVRMAAEQAERGAVKEPLAKHVLAQVCKDISADYWIRSHTLATARLDTATYMKLLDQNLEQAAEIRKLCKDKSLIGQLAKAARSASKPAWIQQEINRRIDANE